MTVSPHRLCHVPRRVSPFDCVIREYTVRGFHTVNQRLWYYTLTRVCRFATELSHLSKRGCSLGKVRAIERQAICAPTAVITDPRLLPPASSSTSAISPNNMSLYDKCDGYGEDHIRQAFREHFLDGFPLEHKMPLDTNRIGEYVANPSSLHRSKS